jgi:beta-glucosidase
VPASDRDEDVAAARRIDGLANRFFLDPILLGAYPDDVVADLRLGEWLAANPTGDVATIAEPIDFMGVNYYFRSTVGAANAWSSSAPEHPTSEPVQLHATTDRRTHMGWPITPDGILDALRMVHRRRPDLPLLITENGSAWDDRVEDGTVHDDARIAYLESHLEACRRAIDEGLPLGGYFAWTLTDNWEWAWGFSRRFGLIRVDHDTLERTMKDSGRWFARFLGGRAGA